MLLLTAPVIALRFIQAAVHGRIEKKNDDAVSRPEMALDVSSLGGMYAGKIRLVGTESGVGVRNAGHIGAQAGEFTLTADGRIENSGSISAQTDVHLATTRELDIRDRALMGAAVVNGRTQE